MNIYSALHYLAIISLTIPPFFLSNCRSLFIYIIYAIIVILHWKFNDDTCILTKLEKAEYPEEFENNEDKGFIMKHLNNLGLEDIANTKHLTEIVLLFLILFAIFRLYYNIKMI